MNKIVKNTAILSFFGLIAIGLGGCSATLTNEAALAQYKSIGTGSFLYLTQRFRAEEVITSGNESARKVIEVDRGEDTNYLYELEESTVDGVTTSREFLIYQTSDTSGLMYSKVDGKVEEDRVDYDTVWENVKDAADTITTLGGEDYTYVFEEHEGSTNTYTRTFLNGLKIEQSYSLDGVKYDLELNFTRQNLLTSNIMTTTNEATGESATNSLIIGYASPFYRKSGL